MLHTPFLCALMPAVRPALSVLLLPYQHAAQSLLLVVTAIVMYIKKRQWQ